MRPVVAASIEPSSSASGDTRSGAQQKHSQHGSEKMSAPDPNPLLIVLSAPSGTGKTTVREHSKDDHELARSLFTVFLTPPSMAVLEERLKRRGQDSPAAIQKRLSVARQEIAQWKHFDYLVVSASIAEDVRKMQAIIEA